MFARFLTGTLFLSLLLSGCNNSAMGPMAQVSGTVSYQGKPLPGGQITFLTSKGYTFRNAIDPEGNYKLKVPVGEAKIVVDNSMLKKSNDPPTPDIRRPPGITPPPGAKMDQEKSSEPAISGTYVPLPRKYQSADASGLTCTVTSGTQTHNIELSP